MEMETLALIWASQHLEVYATIGDVHKSQPPCPKKDGCVHHVSSDYANADMSKRKNISF